MCVCMCTYIYIYIYIHTHLSNRSYVPDEGDVVVARARQGRLDARPEVLLVKVGRTYDIYIYIYI